MGIFAWWPKVTKQALIGDLIACATVAVVLIPQGKWFPSRQHCSLRLDVASSFLPFFSPSFAGMAYGVLAGLDPVYGLISATIPLMIYALFTTSSQVAVGPVAPTSILMATTIQAVTGATPRTPEFLKYHLVLAFLSGVFQILCGILQMGFIASLLSWPVMSGFSSGAAVIIISTQISELLRLTMEKSDNTFVQFGRTLVALPSLHWPSFAVGVPCLLILLFWKDLSIRGWKIPKRTPVPLILVLLAVVISWAADLKSVGVKVVGEIPASLPAPQFPIESFADVKLLLGSAIVIGSVNYIQTVTLAVLFGKKVNEKVNPNGEFFALGFSSTISSFFSCFTCAGSFTRSAIQSEAGAKTPLTTFLSGAMLLVFLYTIIRMFTVLPVTVLAAVVLSSTRPLISVSDAIFLWKVKPSDFVQLIVTFLGVIILGISDGLLLGVGFSLATVLYRSFIPRLVALGRLPGTDVFVALERFPETRPVPGVVVLRLDSALHFGNVQSVTKRLFDELEGKVTPQPQQAITTTSASAAAASQQQPGLASPGGLELSLTSPGLNAPFNNGISLASPGPGTASAVNNSNNTAAAATTATTAAVNSRVVYALATFDNTGGEIESLLAARGLQQHGGDDGNSPNDKDADDIARSASVGRALSIHIREGAAAVVAAASHGSDNAPGGGAQRAESASPWPPALSITADNSAATVAAFKNTPLRAVILDSSRVVDIDATACRELQTVMAAYRKKGVRLLIAGLPGPVRDILEKYHSQEASSSDTSFDPSTIRFLNVMAAIAFLYEKEKEEDRWETITKDLATLASGSTGGNSESASGDEPAHRAGGSFPLGLRARNTGGGGGGGGATASSIGGESSMITSSPPVLLTSGAAATPSGAAGGPGTAVGAATAPPPGLVFSSGSYMASENEAAVGKRSLLGGGGVGGVAV
jgi:sulfate permease, SulP family